VTKVTNEMLIMQEEIFGPLLPILEVDNLEQALQYVNDRPRPLALYYFDRKKKRCQQVLEETHSGGVCINDTILHISQHSVGFGGVGGSGMGRYHGRDGFETFSNKKSVFIQRRGNLVNFLTKAPYPKWAYGLFRLLMRI
jgi:coniferyl-aldehyde dehydrogenase